jgi:dienelactone hydrolase
MQPRWSRDGSLHYLSDVSGFWNLYRVDAAALQGGSTEGDAPAVALCPRQADFGSPAWTLGASSYALLPSGVPLVTFRDPGAAAATLALLREGGEPAVINTPFAEFSGLAIAALQGGGYRIALLGARPDAPTVLASLDVLHGESVAEASGGPGLGGWVAHRAASSASIDAGYVSVPRAVGFPAALMRRTGDEEADADAGVAETSDTELSYCNYYAPRNADFEAPPGTLPPLLVKCHGGPTSSASAAFNLMIQYYTSRGWAVADVDYGGSSGHGRDYRRRLRLAWGVVDVADACCAATTLAARGLADPKRCAIDGGSAGGFTALAALAFRPGVFAAGCSNYGIGDLEALAADTHKFEARYLDGLVGPYPAAAERYKRRSPLHSAAQIRAPLALFQGSEDKVVPPEQAHAVFAAVRARGLPAALCVLQGEQHGFRAAASIRAALDGERCFFSRVFGLAGGAAEPPPDVPPLDIVNL